jgi:hypothetical protein
MKLRWIMSENKTIVPSVTIDCRQYCINVGRDVVRLLGCPECICILESERQHTIAFAPCDDSVVLSFKVPERFPEDRNRKFRIYSQSLVMEIMAKYNLDSGHSYTLKGKLDDVMKAVVFHLDEIYDCTRK